MNTSYASFAQYYETHQDKILKKLHLKKIKLDYADGNIQYVTPVEMIYGNPFCPQKLSEDFWNCFEDSLKEIDHEQINLFFGKEHDDLKELDWYVRAAYKILRESFCSWVQTIAVEESQQKLPFGENCVFINFNYTDTLEKRFHIPPKDIIHIHGNAADRNSIVFGHSSHPHEPEHMLYKLGGRFRGLYYIEKILFETDKHVQDNIQNLILELLIHGVMPESIKDIYVLGHSFGMVDAEYFIFLQKCTSVDEHPVLGDLVTEEKDTTEELFNRIQYAIYHNTNSHGSDPVTQEMRDAVQRQFDKEQAYRNSKYEDLFYKVIGGKPRRKARKRHTSGEISRVSDAKWHISYYSEEDQKHINAFMSALECKDYTLYPSIDDCIKS